MAHLLGIEIGGTKLQLGLGNGDGTIQRLIRLDVDPSKQAEGIRSQILDAFRLLEVEVDAVGVGFGGPVDPAGGTVTKSHQVEGWTGFPLVDWARKELGVPKVALANDADSAALGEALFGAGRGLSPILYVNSGSGIGGGLIVDGKIYRGSGVGAIEIGHLIMREALALPPDLLKKMEESSFSPGPVGTTKFPRQTLEDIASGWAIGEEGRKRARVERTLEGLARPNWSDKPWGEPGSLIRLCRGEPEKVDARMVAESARQGHPDGLDLLKRAVEAMAAALSHAITLLAPKRVILGGGVALMGDDLWLNPIREIVEDRVFPPFRGTFDMKSAELGEDVVVHGALALAHDLVGS